MRADPSVGRAEDSGGRRLGSPDGFPQQRCPAPHAGRQQVSSRWLGSNVGRIFRHRTDRPSVEDPTVLGGLRLRELRPLHEGRATALTKAGRLSLRATLEDGTAVKVTESHGPEHAQLIATLAGTVLADVLPRVLAVSGSLVVSEWVVTSKGTERVDAADLGRLLATVHRATAPGVLTGFDYWGDFLVPRGRRAAATLDASERFERILRIAERAIGSWPSQVTHPDLTADNVLRRDDGRPVIIDNELLGVGRAAWMDVSNLVRSLDRPDRGRATDAYRSAGGVTLEPAALPGLRAMWAVRMLGSFHVAGRLADVARLLEQGPEHLLLPFESRP